MGRAAFDRQRPAGHRGAHRFAGLPGLPGLARLWRWVAKAATTFYTGWYKEWVTELPVVRHEQISLGNKPGLELELLPDLHLRADAVKVSAERMDLI